MLRGSIRLSSQANYSYYCVYASFIHVTLMSLSAVYIDYLKSLSEMVK